MSVVDIFILIHCEVYQKYILVSKYVLEVFSGGIITKASGSYASKILLNKLVLSPPPGVTN